MVKFNKSTKMMVNRCIELLNAKIANAQTRHIAKRVPFTHKYPPTVDIKAIQRERQKAEKYKTNKHLSMWEQSREENDDALPESTRLDHSHYKHCKICDRNYETTWVNFPEKPRSKQSTRFRSEERAPVRRRNNAYNPDTARPYDAESADFLKEWNNNTTMVNRQRYTR